MAQTAGVIQACVVFLVHDHVVVQSDHGADDAQVRLESGGQRDHGFLAQELGQFLFQLQMELQSAVEESGTGTAGSQLLIRLHARLDHFGAGGETKVVVGAEHDAALAFHDDLGILFGLQRVEVGIDPHLHDLVRKPALEALFKNIDHVSSPPLPLSARGGPSGVRRPAARFRQKYNNPPAVCQKCNN